jgi:hypothetical protein
MEVEDAAWLYGIARATAYKSCLDGNIPTKRLGERVRVLSQPVFDELFPSADSTRKSARTTWPDVS